jgi:glycosyltransferase involved in cell wall biosynthesis
MCTCNGEQFIREQLDSIVNQTYPVFELIISDDCSDDNTVEIIKEYAGKYDYIKIFQNKKRKGINYNFWSAIERAQGDYIAISDQDDIWELDKIETQINEIGDKWLCSGFNKPFSEGGVPIFFDRRVPNYQIERLVSINSLPGHTMLFKKSLLDKIPVEYKNLRMYDYMIALVAASYNEIHYCKKNLVNHRRHEKAVTYSRPLNTKFNISNSLLTLKRTFFLYLELKDLLKSRYMEMYEFLKILPKEQSVKEDAQKLCNLLSKKGLCSFFKSVILCISLRDKIFYSKENNQFLSVLRAAYFPVSCVDYIRFKSKKRNKMNTRAGIQI